MMSMTQKIIHIDTFSLHLPSSIYVGFSDGGGYSDNGGTVSFALYESEAE